MVREKKCSQCKTVKPTSEFYNDKSRRDGLRNECKECRRIYDRNRYRESNRYRETRVKGKKYAYTLGIDALNQIDSVLREMAELQFQINTENAACEKRIELIKGYTQEIISPYQLHQTDLRVMLEEYCKKTWGEAKTVVKLFRFGSFRYCRGKLKISLNIKLAGNGMGKP